MSFLDDEAKRLGMQPKSQGGESFLDKEAKRLGFTPASSLRQGKGYLDQLIDSAVSGGAGVYGGIGSMLHADDTADYFYDVAERNREKEPIAPSLSWEYITNPRGLTRSTGEMLGSVASLAPAAFLAPEGAVGAGTALLGRMGVNRLLTGLIGNGAVNGARIAAANRIAQAVPMGVRWALGTSGLESLAEGGGARRDALEEGVSENEATKRSLQTAALNLPALISSNLIEGTLGLGGALTIPARAGAGAVERIATAPIRGLLNATVNSMQQGAEEGIQRGISDYAADKPYGVLPWNWTEGQWDEAKEGFAGSLLFGGVGSTINAARQQSHPNNTPGQEGGQPQLENVEPYNMPTQGANIDEQVSQLTPEFQSALPVIGGILKNRFGVDAVISSGGRTREHQMEVNPSSPNSYHVIRENGGDAVDIVLPDGVTDEQAQEIKRYFANSGAFEEVLFHDAGSGYHLHLGGYKGGRIGGTAQQGFKSSGNNEYDAYIQAAASKYNVPANLLSSLLEVESNYNPNAVSDAGAIGIAQFMPDTARSYGIDPTDPAQAIEGAAHYLSDLYEQFGDWHTALRAYNGGPGGIDLSETKDYADKVMAGAGTITNNARTTTAQQQRQTSPEITEPTDFTQGADSLDQMYASFAEYWRDTATNEEDISFFGGMFNRKGKFKNTEENRAALEPLMKDPAFAEPFMAFMNAEIQRRAEDGGQPQAQTQRQAVTPGTTPQINIQADNLERAREQQGGVIDLPPAQNVLTLPPPAANAQQRPQIVGPQLQGQPMTAQPVQPLQIEDVARLANGLLGGTQNENAETQSTETPQNNQAATNQNQNAQSGQAQAQEVKPAPVPEVNLENLIAAARNGVLSPTQAQVAGQDSGMQQATLQALQELNAQNAAQNARAGAEIDAATQNLMGANQQALGQAPAQAPPVTPQVEQEQTQTPGQTPSIQEIGAQLDEATHNLANANQQALQQNGLAQGNIGQNIGQAESAQIQPTKKPKATKASKEKRRNINDLKKAMGAKTTSEAITKAAQSGYTRVQGEENTIEAPDGTRYHMSAKGIQEFEKAKEQGKTTKVEPKQQAQDANEVQNIYLRPYKKGKYWIVETPANVNKATINAFYTMAREHNARSVGQINHNFANESGGAVRASFSWKEDYSNFITEWRATYGTGVEETQTSQKAQQASQLENAAAEQEQASQEEQTSQNEGQASQKAEQESTEQPTPTPKSERVFDTQSDFVSDRFGSEQVALDNLLEAFGKSNKKFVNVVDDSDEALQAALADFDRELSKISANPVFNPKLMMAAFKVGAIYLQRGANKFANWAHEMTKVRSELEPFLPAVWSSLKVFPTDTKLDGKQMTTMFAYVGTQYDKGVSKADIKKAVAKSLGEGYDIFVDSAYAGVEKYPSAEELKALQEGKQHGNDGGYDQADRGREADSQVDTERTEAVSLRTGDREESVPERAGAGTEVSERVENAPPQYGDEVSENGDIEGIRSSVSGKTGRPENETDGRRMEPGGRRSGGEPESVSVGRGGRQPGEDEQKGQRGAGSSVADERPNDGGKEAPVRGSNRGEVGIARDNYHIEDPSALFGGAPKVRFSRNRKAIGTYQAIKDANREPTQEEKDTMAAFTGWGSFGQELFQGTFENPKPAKGWEEESEWLRDTLGKEDWESAQESIINAHYTSPPVVQALWDMVQRMGFKGGRVLEPSMGVGNFFGMMPKALKQNSTLFGVEMDSVTGGIAQMLYPKAKIQISPYQNVKVADGTYDLVIGNVPFANYAPADRRYNKFNATLHDYFFLKGIDELRPGGLMVAITSKGTMDKANRGVRLGLAKKAELIDAYRFPTGAFKEYAGTDVVTDVLIFRKRETPIIDVSGEKWLATTNHEVKYKGENYDYDVNNFFEEHPEKVLGKIGFGHAVGRRPGLSVTMNTDNFQQQLDDMAANVQEGVYQEAHYDRNLKYESNNAKDRYGTLQMIGDKLYVATGIDSKPLEAAEGWSLGPKNASTKMIANHLQELKDLVRLREAYNKLEDAEKADAKDLEKLRKELRSLYEAHVTKYCLDKNGKPLLVEKTVKDNAGKSVKVKRPKLLEDTAGLKLFKKNKEPNYYNLCALQRKDGTMAKILTQRVMRAEKKKISNPTVQEALMIQRNKSMRIDVGEIAKLCKKSEAQVLKELKGVLFKTPNGDYQVKDQYLSGNVRRKLREAKAAYLNGDASMRNNIEALQKVIPEDIPYYNITVSFGGPWIDIPYYQQFIAELVGAKNPNDVQITRNKNGAWKVVFANKSLNNSAGATTTYGMDKVKFDHLLTHAFNHTQPNINYKDTTGVHKDEEAIKKAISQMEKIRETFADWIWKDEKRKTELAHNYNEIMNSVATPEYDGSFLDMVGMMLTKGDKEFNLRQHQINAIYRGLVNGSGIYAHEVGTGKTYTMGGLAIESRRFGLAKKPLILAHNANSKSVAREIQEMYPGAKVLYISGSKDEVKRGLMRAKMDDWDAVVIPHTKVDMLTLTEKTLEDMSAELIAELEDDAIEAAKGDGIELSVSKLDDEEYVAKLKSPTAKELALQRLKIKETIRRNAYKSSNEGAIPFEELGFDMVIVDEAHAFKKPPFSTKMNVKGLQKDTSQRSTQLQFLTWYIQDTHNGKGVHLFTGTPITNTITEMYHMMKYVMPEQMKEAGVFNFDDWFNTFANATSDLEYTSTGEIETVTRLNAFTNVPELRRMVGQYMDIVYADDMPEFEPRKTVSGKTLADKDLTEKERDYLLNGRDEAAVGRPYMRTINEVIPMNDAQKGILSMFMEYAKQWRGANGLQRKKIMQEQKPQAPLFISGAVHKAAMDARLYDRTLNTDGMDSKEARVVKNVLDIYNSDKRTTQVIMMDQGIYDSSEQIPRDERGYPVGAPNEKGKYTKQKVETFNLRNSIKKMLLDSGIPESEIAVVDGSTSSDRKAEIAAAVDRGEIRVVIGGTGTLGTGVNMQSNLKAIHHVDAPWMPGDLEQRNGRILRQGNKWNTVLEYRYVTEKMDGRRWQALAMKQKFIKMFLKADNSLRVLDGDAVDVSESEEDQGNDNDIYKTLSEATGDPRLLRRAKLEDTVKKLERAHDAFVAGIEEARYKLRQLKDGGLKTLQDGVRRLKTIQGKYAKYRQSHPDSYEITIDGKTYDNRQDADKAIAETFRKYSDHIEREFKLGEFAGLPLYGYRQRNTDFTGSYQNRIRISDGEKTIPTFSCADSTAGITQKLGNVGNTIEREEAKLETAENDVKILEKQIKGTFPREKVLQAKQQELANLEKDLKYNPVPPPQWLVEGAPMQTEVVVDGKPGEVASYRVSKDGKSFYVGVQEEGSDRIAFHPWQKLQDSQGLQLITAPDGIEETTAELNIGTEEEATEDDFEATNSGGAKFSIDNGEETGDNSGIDKGSETYARATELAMRALAKRYLSDKTEAKRLIRAQIRADVARAKRDGKPVERDELPTIVKLLDAFNAIHESNSKGVHDEDLSQLSARIYYARRCFENDFGEESNGRPENRRDNTDPGRGAATAHAGNGNTADQSEGSFADLEGARLLIVDAEKDDAHKWWQQVRDKEIAHKYELLAKQKPKASIDNTIPKHSDKQGAFSIANKGNAATVDKDVAGVLQRNLGKLAKQLGGKYNAAIGRYTFKDEATLERFTQIANGLIKALDPVNAAKYSITAWHGTPHDFERFSLQAIGTGEGAQVHGWGLYFAGSREVSEGYRDRLSVDEENITVTDTLTGKELSWEDFDYENDFTNPLAVAFDSLGDFEGNADKAAAWLERRADIEKESPVFPDDKQRSANRVKAMREAAKILNSGRLKANISGHLYQVEIPDTDVMLDEQKTLAEQPEKVRNALLEIVAKHPQLQNPNSKVAQAFEYVKEGLDYINEFNEFPFHVFDDLYGKGYLGNRFKYKEWDERLDYLEKHLDEAEKILTSLSSTLEINAKAGILGEYSHKTIYDIIQDKLELTPKETSKLLLKHGIKGITYEGGTDGRCYVVFDPQAIDIIAKFSADAENARKLLKTFDIADLDSLNREQERLSQLGEEMGTPIVWFDADPSLNGFHSNGVTFLNRKGRAKPEATFWHETFHWIKANNNGLARELVGAVQEAGVITKEQIEKWKDGKNRHALSDEEVIEEILADEFINPAKFNELANKLERAAGEEMTKVKPGLVERLMAWIKKLADRFIEVFQGSRVEPGVKFSEANNALKVKDRILTTAQRDNFIRAVGKMAGEIKDSKGRNVFKVTDDGKGITLADGKPLPGVKFSAQGALKDESPIANGEKVRDNSGKTHFIKGHIHPEHNRVQNKIVLNETKTAIKSIELGLPIDPNETDEEKLHRRMREIEGIDYTLVNMGGNSSYVNLVPDTQKEKLDRRIDAGEDPEALVLHFKTKFNEMIARYADGLTEEKRIGYALLLKGAAYYVAERAGIPYNAERGGGIFDESTNGVHGQEERLANQNRITQAKHSQSGSAFSTAQFSIDASEPEQRWLDRVGDKLARALHLKGDRIITDTRQNGAGENLGVKQYFLNSPSRIAAKVRTFKHFFTMADTAMRELTNLRNSYQKKYTTAMDTVKNKEDRESLFKLLLTGDMEGKEYGELTQEERTAIDRTYPENKNKAIRDAKIKKIMREAEVSRATADAYLQIRRLMTKAYHMLNEARRRPQTTTARKTQEEVEELRANKFVVIMDEGERENGGMRRVTYKEYANHKEEYKQITESEAELLKGKAGVQVLSVTPLMRDGKPITNDEGEALFNVTTREGIPDINRLKGYIPHFFHEYMIRVVDRKGKPVSAYGYGGVIGSGRSQREAVKAAEQWKQDNRLKDGEQILIAPKVMDFRKLGMDETQYAPIMGDKDFAAMLKALAQNNDMTVAEAKEMMDGSVKLKNRHRFYGNLLQRKGAKGYEDDMAWVLRHYFNSASRYAALESEFKPKAISLFERLFGAFDKDYDDNALAKYTKQFINDVNGTPSTLEKLLNEWLNNTTLYKNFIVPTFGERATLGLTNAITSRVSYLTLGMFNLSSSLLNFTQLVNAAAYLGSPVDLMKYVGKGAKGDFNFKEMRILKETGVLGNIGLDSGSGYDQNRGYSGSSWKGLPGLAIKAVDRIGNTSMKLFTKIDMLCRISTVLAAYDKVMAPILAEEYAKAKAQGLSGEEAQKQAEARARTRGHDEAISYATEINRKANFEYGVHDAPNVFRRGSVISQLALQFKKYGFKELEVISDFMPQSNKTTMKQKMMFFGMYFMMCGLMGIPFLDWLDDLFGERTGMFPKDFIQKSIMEACGDTPTGKRIASMVMYGGMAAGNINLSQRAGLSDVIPTRAGDFAGPTLSKTYNATADMLKYLFADGNGAQVVRDLSPGIYNFIAAYKGESRGQRGRLNSRYESTMGRIIRAMGFRSVDESWPSDLQRIETHERARLTKEKQRAIDAYIADPSTENFRELRRLKITPTTVQNERKRKEMDREERLEEAQRKR